MCDWHHSHCWNRYHQYLQQGQLTWGYQQQHVFACAATSHLANNIHSHFCSAHVPPPLCLNQRPCHCYSALALPAHTCCIYTNNNPYCCFTDGPLPVNTGYTSPSYCYPRRNSVMIEPYFFSGCASDFQNAAKYESASKHEDDYSPDGVSCNRIQSSSKYKQPLVKKAKEMKKLKKGGRNYSVDNDSCKNRRSFSKYDQAYIRKKAIKMIKVSNYEEVSSDSDTEIPSKEMGEKLLSEIRAILEEEEENEEGFTFKILEPYDVKDSEITDVKSQDAESEDSPDTESEDSYDTGSEETTESDDCAEPTGTKSEDCADPPRYGLHSKRDAYGEMQTVFGRMAPKTLEDDLLKKELEDFVYGTKVDAIRGQESLMISKFERLFDMSFPKLWPVTPIDP